MEQCSQQLLPQGVLFKMHRLTYTITVICSMLAFFAYVSTGHAQDEYIDYNEESVGIVDYNDTVAAGDSPATTDATADTVVESEPTQSAPSAATEDGAADSDAEFSVDAAVDANGEAAGDADAEDEWDTSHKKKVDGVPVKVTHSKRDKRQAWEWGAIRHHSSWSGTSGLMDIKLAGSSPMGTLGAGVFGGFFKYSDYLINGDENTFTTGTIGIRASVWKYIEIHGAIKTYANHNTMEYPKLFQTIGDIDLGVKGYYPVTDMISLGMDMYFNILNAVGDVGINPQGTSVGFDALATFDFGAISESVPVRGHLMVGYLFDNAYNIIDSIESQAGGCGSDSDGDGNVEYAGCLSPVERTALGIDRNDQFHLGFGLDAAFPYISPIIEYHLDVPVNRQDFVCPQIPGSYDSCMKDAGSSAMRQWMNFGVRALPPVKGLAVDFGFEVGLSGYAPTVHELAAQEPYMVKFGLTYQFNPFVKPKKCVPKEKIVEVPAAMPQVEEAPKAAQIVGMVHDESSSTMPVADAVVVYAGMELNPQLTSAAGRFNSYELPPGEATLSISAPNYEAQQFTVVVPETGFVEQLFPLTAAVRKGQLSVLLLNEKGKPIAGISVKVEGTVSGAFVTDDDGIVTLEADAGPVHFTVSDEKYLHKKMTVVAKAEAHEKAQMELKSKGKKNLVVVKNDRIRIRRKIHFKVNSDVIATNSYQILDEVADTLAKNPHIGKVEIQGHTDDRGQRTHNVELSQKRAEAVRSYLMNAGIEETRLDAKGFGPDKPIAPNVIETGRAKNRRVEFHITKSDSAQ